MSEAFTARLIAARRARERAAEIGAPPADYAAAMAVQAAVARGLGAQVAAWKVALRPEGVAVGAPIFAADLRTSGGTWPFSALTVGIEVEIALRLKRDLRPGAITRADILSASTLLLGLEIAETRIADPKPPYPAALADNMGNGGYVVGPDQADAAIDLQALTARVTVDGKVAFDGPARHASGDPLAPAVAWAAKPTDRLGGLCKGQIITTGALCGVIPITGPARIEANLSGFGAVSVIFT